jgi:transcriptional regulator with GAF, ATPase, and Fis domain
LEEQCAGEIRGFDGIVGTSPALLEVIELIRTVAPTDSTVLIEGETEPARNLLRGPSTHIADATIAPLSS